MSERSLKRIPVNLISGALGVGKTTMVNHLLQHRPPSERWAVLVNEYGLVGLDAALMEGRAQPGEGEGVEIREVAGGCICCSAGFMFEVSLALLLQRRPDRLLIEPTGLASLSGILDTLDRPGIRDAVDVRSILCLLDPARFRETIARKEIQDQVEAADVLLAGRPDLATAEQLDSFHAWAKDFFPPKRWVGQADKGRVELAILDLVSERSAMVPRGGYRHGTDHDRGHDRGHDHNQDHNQDHEHDHHPDRDARIRDGVQAERGKDLLCSASRPIVLRSHVSPVASTIGWVCWEGLVFDAERSSNWLQELAQLPGARRTKAVLRTNEGWWGFNLADGVEEIRPSGYRRDSRLELVIESEVLPDTESLEQALRECILSSATPAGG